MKTLWIVSGGTEAVPGIARAKKMGLHVVVSDANPEAPGFSLANDCVVASTYDIEKTVEAAKRYMKQVRPIDGVLSVAADVPLTVAHVAQELGLPGVSIETARLASDKLAMKEKFAAAGIPIPWFSFVESWVHLSNIVEKRKYPLVVKPVDSRGARGVLRITRDVDLNWAYEHAKKNSPTGRVMVEQYLEGPQISTESIIQDGKGYTPGFSDRNYEFLESLAPYIIENGGQQPTRLGTADRDAVARCAVDAGLALGIRNGVAKGDMVLTPQGPTVIEVAARLSGGWFSTDQIPLATGVDFLGAAIRLALGKKIDPSDLAPRFNRGVAIRYFFPKPGTVLHIHGIDEIEHFPWVHRFGLFVKPGDYVRDVSDHTQRAGFVITVGATREEAVNRAKQAADTIRIETMKE